MEPRDWITLVGVVVGLVWWRVQLIGKRRTELAEEALTAFGLAADALAYVRSGFLPAGEIYEALKEAEIEPALRPGAPSTPGIEFLVSLWRMRREGERFAPLRKTELLVRYHFGDMAADALAELANVRGEVVAAATVALKVARASAEGSADTPFLLDARSKVSSMGARDRIGNRIEEARAMLEAELKPHLRADAALLPIYAVPGRVAAWARSIRPGKPGA